MAKTSEILSYNIKYVGTDQPTITTDAEWITDLRLTDNGFAISVAENQSLKPRSATVNIKYYGRNYPVEVLPDEQGKM